MKYPTATLTLCGHQAVGFASTIGLVTISAWVVEEHTSRQIPEPSLCSCCQCDLDRTSAIRSTFQRVHKRIPRIKVSNNRNFLAVVGQYKGHFGNTFVGASLLSNHILASCGELNESGKFYRILGGTRVIVLGHWSPERRCSDRRSNRGVLGQTHIVTGVPGSAVMLRWRTSVESCERPRTQSSVDHSTRNGPPNSNAGIRHETSSTRTSIGRV
jgi:hypothetical protein